MRLNQIQVESMVSKEVMSDKLKVGLVSEKWKICASSRYAEEFHELGFVQYLIPGDEFW